MVDAVIFDLWNTLIAVDKAYSPYPRIQRLFGTANEDDFREVMRAEWMTRAGVGVEEFYEIACARMGRPNSAAERDSFVMIWEDYLQHVEIVPGVEEILATLRERGIKTAIVTNTVEPSLRFVRKIELADRVDVVVGSSDCGFLKPDPRIFQLAVDELDVEPTRCAVVGDKLRTDILGGLILGMQTIFLEPRYRDPQRGGGLPVDAVIPALDRLGEVL
jgi:putative hydrolase of the HAD superfamily